MPTQWTMLVSSACLAVALLGGGTTAEVAAQFRPGPVGSYCRATTIQTSLRQPSGLPSLAACQAVCLGLSTCDAVFYAPPGSPGLGTGRHRCYTATGPCTDLVVEPTFSIYFRITAGLTAPTDSASVERTTPTAAPSAAPTTDSSWTGPTTSRTCRNATDELDGTRQLGATTPAACRAACLGINGCTAITFKTSSIPRFTRCYTAIGPCTSTYMRAGFSVWRVVAPTPPPTPPIVNPGDWVLGQQGFCRNASVSLDGTQQSANSLADCEMACLGITGCDAISYSPSRPLYNRCYTAIGPCTSASNSPGFQVYLRPGITSAPNLAPIPSAGRVTLTTCYFDGRRPSGICYAATQATCNVAANAQGFGATCTAGCFNTSHASWSSCHFIASMIHTCQDSGTGQLFTTTTCSESSTLSPSISPPTVAEPSTTSEPNPLSPAPVPTSSSTESPSPMFVGRSGADLLLNAAQDHANGVDGEVRIVGTVKVRGNLTVDGVDIFELVQRQQQQIAELFALLNTTRCEGC